MKNKLIHAVTEFDRKQSAKRGYNHYALGQYFMRVDEICADVERGANPRQAILAGFTGRLADCCLKAIGEPISTDAESRGGFIYNPVTK